MAGDADGQCGPGTRQPLLVISPYSKVNHIDNTYTEQTSVTKFIQDNWELGRLSEHSFDNRAGKLDNMFDFDNASAEKLFLNETDGTVAKDYDSIERVDDSDRAGEKLKDVAEGMNDPKVTEKDVQNAAASNGKNNAAGESDSNHLGAWLGMGAVAVIVLGFLTWISNRKGESES